MPNMFIYQLKFKTKINNWKLPKNQIENWTSKELPEKLLTQKKKNQTNMLRGKQNTLEKSGCPKSILFPQQQGKS
jgi:hypothetical protein